jgi:hypothetical protein
MLRKLFTVSVFCLAICLPAALAAPNVFTVVTVVPTPEPMSVGLIGGGLVGLAVLHWRRRSDKK